MNPNIPGKLQSARLVLILTSLFLIFNSCDESEIPEKLSGTTDSDFPAFAGINDGSEAPHVIDLNGPWKFKATDETEWMEALVPGTVQQDLIRVGRLEDPYYRDNELDAQWVEKKEWEYERSFTVDEAFLERDRILLDCRGLDVICELYLNDELLAETQNMFIEYEFDVRDRLKAGTNTLRAVFRSVLEWNKKQADADPRVTWRSGDAVTNDATKGLLYYSRKEASDFGWDWGLRLVSCGIWKSIRLVGYDTGRITRLGVRQDLTDPDEAVLTANAVAETYRTGDYYIDFEVRLRDSVIARTSQSLDNGMAEAILRIPEPRLWWPNGMGEQPLYTVEAVLKSGDNHLHKRKVRTGLRTIEIAREKDELGESFGIRVNGDLIFWKGANWVPADAMPGRLTEGHYRHLLGSCIEANMNMLRLWGGGLYEPDVFYEFCDENGIMIWHDFMFASGPYLATEPYLENVRAEIKNVVLRRRHHPSIALWCGNNESEHNMGGGQRWLYHNPGVSWEEYDKIFYQVIPRTAALYDPDRPYWPSSPHHPLDREEKSPVSKYASGNSHTYDVWGGSEPFSAYSEMGKYNFVAEFGFVSLPHIQTVYAFTAPEDRYFPSVVLDHHILVGKKPNQDRGNVRIAQTVAEIFIMPTGIENWAYVSQILQGEGMKMGCEAMRRNFPNTTGALYWQLDDNWPVLSSSSIDYYGRWKALHYMAKHFFNPVLVSGVAKDGIVGVYGSNDLPEDQTCTLEWALQHFDGTVSKSGSRDAILPAISSSLLETLDLSEFVIEDPEMNTYRKESYRNRSDAFLSFRLVRGDSILSENFLFFLPPKHWNLQEPKIRHSISEEGGRTRITLSADRFAAYVELGVKDSYARFSDNYFHLLPGETRTVEVISSEVPDKTFNVGFFVRSLIDSYTECQ